MDGVFAAGDAYGVSGGEFFNILSVGGKQQGFSGSLNLDFNDAGVGNDQWAVAEGMGADHADAKRATAGLQNRAAGGEGVSGTSGGGADNQAVARKGADLFVVNRQIERRDVRRAAEADHRVVENTMGFAEFPVAHNDALGDGAGNRDTVAGFQRIECLFKIVLAHRGQEAEAAQIDSKDWNLRAVEQFGREQNGTIAAHRQ